MLLPGLWGDGWVGGEEEQRGRRGTEVKVPIGEEVIGEGMRGDHGEDERGEGGGVVVRSGRREGGLAERQENERKRTTGRKRRPEENNKRRKG